MNLIQRTLVAAVLACTPLLSLAAGFKCQQTNGSISYQDHPCAPNSASSSAIATDMSGMDLGLPALDGLDPSCKANVQHTISVCAPQVNNTVTRCYHASLTAHCYLQMTSGAGVHREQACVQQASSCIAEGVRDVQRCVRQEIQPACIQQAAALRRSQSRF